MQVTEPETQRRVGVDEKYIKFRSSPNFKNMKKFLKSKIDNEENSNASPPGGYSPPTPSPTPSLEAKEKEKIKPEPEGKEKIKPNPLLQPPLPLEPPPPSPPINIKKEIEELESDFVNDTAELQNELNLVKQEFPPDQMEDTKKKKRPVCRDFLRGTCSRPGTCRYAHEYDLTQLSKVYTFCRNFQNSVCTYVNCKYVHATVFEEQKFYRTGILPPHVLNKKKSNVLPPPPPPPPEDPPKLDIPTDFSNPPPLLNGCRIDKSLPAVLAQATNVPLPSAMISATSPQRAVAHSPRDYEPNELLAKTCSRCEWLEFSLQYNKDMVDKMRKTIEEDRTMMTHLNTKYQKLYNIILGYLKSTVKAPIFGGMNNLTAEKENHLLERLLKYFGNQSRVPMSDDTNKFIS